MLELGDLKSGFCDKIIHPEPTVFRSRKRHVPTEIETLAVFRSIALWRNERKDNVGYSLRCKKPCRRAHRSIQEALKLLLETIRDRYASPSGGQVRCGIWRRVWWLGTDVWCCFDERWRNVRSYLRHLEETFSSVSKAPERTSFRWTHDQSEAHVVGRITCGIKQGQLVAMQERTDCEPRENMVGLIGEVPYWRGSDCAHSNT